MSDAAVGEHERADARRNRERILCAAACLVDEYGIDGVSMDDVASRAGVGKGTLYRRFGDRASLLRALIDEPERAFQDALIRGEPPLGPGAPALERLKAFGAGALQLLEQNARFQRAAEAIKAGRFGHPVYIAHQLHVGLLLREILGEHGHTDYLVECLLAPLAADAFLYQRGVQGLSLDEVIDGWSTLADAVAATANR
jgi:AcrR family transcriptional regulator